MLHDAAQRHAAASNRDVDVGGVQLIVGDERFEHGGLRVGVGAACDPERPGRELITDAPDARHVAGGPRSLEPLDRAADGPAEDHLAVTGLDCDRVGRDEAPVGERLLDGALEGEIGHEPTLCAAGPRVIRNLRGQRTQNV
jgi:hypothetical protein